MDRLDRGPLEFGLDKNWHLALDRRQPSPPMWTCPKCGEQHEDQFKSCWKCTGQSIAASDAEPPKPDPLRCPRCLALLTYVGNRKFHEGTRWGILGDLGELFVNRASFDVYVCTVCGRVEFFVDGIGEEFRPRETPGTPK